MKLPSLLIVISLSVLLALVGCQHQEQDTTQTENQSSVSTNETQETETQTSNTQESDTSETEEQSNADPDTDVTALIETGQQLAAGCVACHSIDGSDGIGPTWLGLYGSTRTLSDDSTVVADDDYIKESILEPMAKLVKGYQAAMPAYSYDADQISALIAYMRSLDE